MIPPQHLRGVNYSRPEKVAKLAASMKARGWEGRPLLIEEAVHGLAAWTGSHRIEAAQEAGLGQVPCRVISRDQSQKGLDVLPDSYGFDSLRGALTTRANGGGPSDRDRLAGLRRLGLDDAAAALEEEIASEEW